MKSLLKVLMYPFWATWCLWVFAICVNRAVDVELEQEEMFGVEIDTELEDHYFRQEVRKRWGGDPPAAVKSFLVRKDMGYSLAGGGKNM